MVDHPPHLTQASIVEIVNVNPPEGAIHHAVNSIVHTPVYDGGIHPNPEEYEIVEEERNRAGRELGPYWKFFLRVKDIRPNASSTNAIKGWCTYCGKAVDRRYLEDHAQHCVNMAIALRDDISYNLLVGNYLKDEKKKKLAFRCLGALCSDDRASLVEDPLFIQWSDILISSKPGELYHKLPSAKTLFDSIIPTVYEELKCPVNDSDPISLAIDGWTSRDNDELYAIVLTQNGHEYIHEVIPLLTRRPNATTLKEIIEKSVKHIKNGEQLVQAIVSDGGRNIQRARYDYCKEHPVIESFTCSIHLMNTILRRMLKSEPFKSYTTDISKFIKSFTMSNVISTRLKELRKEKHESKCTISPLAATRFSSIYHSICDIYVTRPDIEEVLDKLNSESQSSQSQPAWPDQWLLNTAHSNSFWTKAYNIKKLIEPICQVIDDLQGSSTRLSDTFVRISSMIIETDKIVQELYPDDHQRIMKSFKKGLDFITNPVCMLTTYLDLRFDVPFTEEAMSIIKEAYKKKIHSSDPAVVANCMQSFDSFVEGRDAQKRDFIESPPTVRNKTRPVSVIAQRLFSIVPHSLSCERVFSVMGWINNPRRARMTKEHLTMATKIHYVARDERQKFKRARSSHGVVKSTADYSDQAYESYEQNVAMARHGEEVNEEEESVIREVINDQEVSVSSVIEDLKATVSNLEFSSWTRTMQRQDPIDDEDSFLEPDSI